MAKVVLAQSKPEDCTQLNVSNTVERALDKLEFDFDSKTKSVLIKPNLCYYWDYSTGETTDPRVVSAVIDYVKSRLGNDVDILIAEADASAMKTKFAFRVLGYDKLCQRKSVKLSNLSEGTIHHIPVNVSGHKLALPINEILLNADLVINVPKLKSHNFVGVTCALKNMFGAISKPRKYEYHKIISEVIVGMNKIVKSDITIVDGLVAKGAYPVKLGVIVTGNDTLATDFTVARLMGFNPKKISHLNLASNESIGQTRDIEIIEEVKLSEIRKKFPHYSVSMHNFSWNLQLKLLNYYTKIAGDVFPPFLEK
jgi:uncharacterized protein (DUF362 family)